MDNFAFNANNGKNDNNDIYFTNEIDTINKEKAKPQVKTKSNAK